jgi:hypothetical protein
MAPSRNVAHSRIALSGLVIGMLLLGIATLWTNQLNWSPVFFSVGPMPSVSRSPNFSIGPGGTYEIGLEVDRTMPFETLNCLVGWGEVRGSERCTGLPTMLDMNWKVFADGKLVAQGTSNDMTSYNGTSMSLGGWVSNDAMYRVIGHFQGTPGHNYTVEVELLNDIHPLAQAKPRLAIRVPSMEHEGNALLTAFIEIVGAAFAVAGAIWLGSSFVYHRHFSA